MPKLLSEVCPTARISIGAEYIRSASGFAQAVAGVIAFWAHCDGNLAAILSFMLDTDIRTGVAMYQAIKSADAKERALLAAADQAREEWEAALLRAVIRANQSSRQQRNEFAHGIWGYAPEVPDAVLLMETSVVMDKNVSHRQAEEVSEGRGVIRPQGLDPSKIKVYRKSDFEDALRSAECAYTRTVNYYYMAGYKDERVRVALLSDMQVRKAIDRLCQKRSAEFVEKLRRPEPGDNPPAGYKISPFVKLPE